MRYFIIVIHKKGAFPEIVREKRHSLPLMYDTREEAEAVAERGRGRDGWKATVVELNDGADSTFIGDT